MKENQGPNALSGVMREDGRMRIEVELVAADPENVVWVESFDLSAAELLAVQRELAQTVAENIQAVVAVEYRTRLQRKRTSRSRSDPRLLTRGDMDSRSSMVRRRTKRLARM